MGYFACLILWRAVMPSVFRLFKADQSYVNMPVNSAFFAIAISGVWWVIHWLQNKYSLLINGDIAEIAISMSYLLYIILYYQVFRLWREGKVKGVWYGAVFPVFATLGSLFVLSGVDESQCIIFVIIAMIASSAVFLYGKNAEKNVKMCKNNT